MRKEAEILSQRSHEGNTMKAAGDVIRPEMMQQETRNTRAADSAGLPSSSAVLR
jgi:hypothetical protein